MANPMMLYGPIPDSCDLGTGPVEREFMSAREVTPFNLVARLTERVSPKVRQFIAALSWNLAGHALVRITILVAGLGIARSLGVEQFADFTFYLFSINLLAAFSDMGISYAMMKYGIVARLDGADLQSVDRLAATLQLGLVGFLLSFVLMLLFTRVSSWPHWQIAALGFAGLAVVWQVTFAAVLLSMRRLRKIFVGNLIFAVVLLGGVIIGAGSSSPIPAMIAFPIGALAQCAYQARLVNRLLGMGWNEWLHPRPREMPAIFRFIGYMAPTSLIASALPWAVANIQLSQGASKTSLAVFGAASMLFGLTMTIPARIAQLFFVDQVEHGLTGRHVRRLVAADFKAIAVSTLTALLMVGGLFLFGDILLDRYGPEIAIHSPAIYALAAVAVIVCPYQIVGNRIVSMGWQKFWLPVTIIQAVVLLLMVQEAPFTAEWNPSVGYWASYGAALLAALPLYFCASKRPRA